MPFTMFTLAMLLICILCIGKEAFKGFRRGHLRALVSLCAVVLGIICSVFISRAVGGVLSDWFMETAVNEFIEDNVDVLAGFPSVYETVSFFVQAFASTLTFTVVFPILNLTIKALLAVVIRLKLRKSGGEPRAENKKDKTWGAIIGGLCGVLVAAAVTSPVMGTLHLARDAINVVKGIDENILTNGKIDLSELDSVNECASDVVGNFCYTMGGELIYRHVAVGEFDGKYVSAANEIKYIRGVAESAVDIVGGFSKDGGSLDFSKSSDKLYENFEDSEILKSVASEIISEFASAWLRGEGFFGIQMPNVNDDLEPLVNELLAVCSAVNENSVTSTARTLLDIVGVLIECDIGADSRTEDIDYFTAIPKLCRVLEKNPNMANVKWKLEDIALGTIASLIVDNLPDIQQMDIITAITNDTAEVLGSVYGSYARREAVSEKLSERFDEFGVSIDRSFCEFFANKLVTTAESKNDQISMSDIVRILIQN